MALYNIWERKSRPGVHMRIVNRGAQDTLPTQTSPVPLINAVLVTANGVMYNRGHVFSMEQLSDYGYILIFEQDTGVAAMVSGDTLDIQNPGN